MLLCLCASACGMMLTPEADKAVIGAEEEVVEYLDALLSSLSGILAQGQMQAKVTALSAISSAARAAKHKFQPYLPALIPLLRSFLAATEARFATFL